MNFSVEFYEGDKFNVSMNSDTKKFNADYGNIFEVSTSNYNDLSNKPSINDVELIGNKTNEDIGIKSLSNIEIENLIKSFV